MTSPTVQTTEELIATARKAAVAVYIAVDEPVADDLSRILNGLVDALVAVSPKVVTTIADLDAAPRDSIVHVVGGSAAARKTGRGGWSCDHNFHPGEVSSEVLFGDGSSTLQLLFVPPSEVK